MSLTLTDNALAALAQSTKEPNLVLKVDGVDRVYGAQLITKYVRFGTQAEIGDPEVDDDCFYIGGMNLVADQDNIITLDGTSTSVKQTLNTDKAEGGTITSLQIALIDDGYATQLITPGTIVDDLLQRKAKVYMGFNGTAWPDDYLTIFRGIITDIVADPGKIVLTINAPDDKKRTNIYKKITTTLLNAIDADDTAICLESITGFLGPITGPFGADDTFKSYVRIDDEIIRYEQLLVGNALSITGSGVNSRITIGTPAVVSSLGHGLPEGAPIVFTTSGSLPTGITAGATYYVRNPTGFANFNISSTPAGALINTSGSQTYPHTLTHSAMIKTITRAQLDTTAASHAADAEVSTFYRLTGNGTELALKLMLSGDLDGTFGVDATISSNRTAIDVSAINISPDGTRYDDSLFFQGVDVYEEYGLTVGDCIYQLDAPAPNNGLTSLTIEEIVRTDLGDFVILEGPLYLTDMVHNPDLGIDLSADIVSQYAVLPDGCRMSPDEVDVDEHTRLNRLFLNSVEYDIYIKDGIDDAREFIEQEIYKPMAAYSLPRKAKASMGYHIGPIPGTNIQTFNETNVKSPGKIQLRRSTNRNFWNEIIYKYDEDALEDQFRTGYIAISEDSKTRIPGANRTMTITSKGMRTLLSGDSIAAQQSVRRLRRYEYGAETLVFESMLDAAYAVEIGDIVVFDGSNLSVPDIKTGTKGMAPRFFEVANKDLQLKTGAVRLELIDTKFDGAARYGLVSPASRIKSGISTTQFVIEESFASRFNSAEYRKWKDLRNCSVRIRNSDFSTVDDTVIVSATSNTITVSPALAFTPSAGMIMELTGYDDADVTDQIKLIYGHMRDSAFADGLEQFKML